MTCNHSEEIVLCQAFSEGPQLAKKVTKPYLTRVSTEFQHFVKRTRNGKPENLVKHFKEIVNHFLFWMGAGLQAPSTGSDQSDKTAFVDKEYLRMAKISVFPHRHVYSVFKNNKTLERTMGMIRSQNQPIETPEKVSSSSAIGGERGKRSNSEADEDDFLKSSITKLASLQEK